MLIKKEIRTLSSWAHLELSGWQSH